MVKTAGAIWSSVLSDIAQTIKPEQFQTWFKDATLESATPQEAVVSLPNSFYCKWFELHYRDMIVAALEREFGSRPSVRFDIRPRELAPQVPHQASPTPQAPTNPPARPSIKLNRDYVFSRFVVGPSNQLAHAAALAVVDAPGTAYNPLFLHGGVGLGKTHLMHAVAHQLLKRRPDFHVRYFSCESFMNQFIYAIQKGGIEQFRARCRQVDVLLIDDIHILARRTRTQEEFFHTFNDLYNAQKQIILSSDSAPDDMPTFEERLVSRFKWGMVARIDPPCLETRMAIVRKKAELRGRTLPDDVVAFIAESIPSNIRELEGAVLKTIGYASLMNRPADLALVREILRLERPAPHPGAITCDRIQEVVAQWYGITPAQLRDKTRTRSVAFPRQISMYLTRRLTSKSLAEIGSAHGGRDHSTVVHACDHVEHKATADPQLEAVLNSLIRQLKGE